MNKRSKERLGEVMPELSRRVEKVLQSLAQDGLAFEVTQGLRTFDEQSKLYAQGRTTPGIPVTNARAGQSLHNFGLAVDVVKLTGGKVDWSDRKAYFRFGLHAEALGLEWGGRWHKFVDLPHVEVAAMSPAQCLRLYRAGGLAAVWRVAANELK